MLMVAAIGLNGCAPLSTTYQTATAPLSTRPVPLDDQCLGQPGYSTFRAKLSDVVARRDVAAFRNLFDGESAMRVHSISLDATSWTRPEAAMVWRELEAILPLGCVRHGERLYLPAMAALLESGAVDSETDVVLTATAARERPEAAAPILRTLARGEIVERINYNASDGWNEVRIGERSGFVPIAHLRSTHSFMLVLARDGSVWKIREFIGGI